MAGEPTQATFSGLFR